jgi:hypothetical protein
VKVRTSTVHHAFVVRLGRVYDVGSGFTAEDLGGEILGVSGCACFVAGRDGVWFGGGFGLSELVAVDVSCAPSAGVLEDRCVGGRGAHRSEKRKDFPCSAQSMPQTIAASFTMLTLSVSRMSLGQLELNYPVEFDFSLLIQLPQRVQREVPHMCFF